MTCSCSSRWLHFFQWLRTRRTASRRTGRGASEEGKTAGIRVVRPERRDIRMTVVQPGTIAGV